MSTVEEQVVSLIRKEGLLRKDLLKERYRDTYGSALVHEGTLTQWLETLESVELMELNLMKVKEKNIKTNGKSSMMDMDETIEGVKEILRLNEGSMTLSSLNKQYCQRFGEPSTIERRLTRPFLQAMSGILVTKKKICLATNGVYINRDEMKASPQSQSQAKVDDVESSNKETTVSSQSQTSVETAATSEICPVVSNILEKHYIDSEDAIYTSGCLEKLLQQAETVNDRFLVVSNFEVCNDMPSILTIGTNQACVAIDCEALAWSTVLRVVLPFLQSNGIWMAANNVASFSSKQEDAEVGSFHNLLDMQLITELWTGNANCGLEQQLLHLKAVQSKGQVPRLCLVSKRPIPQKVLEDCFIRFQLLYQAAASSINSLTETDLDLILSATQEKTKHGTGLWFDENNSYRVASYALLRARYGKKVLSFQPYPLRTVDEVDNVLELLPSKLQNGVRQLGLDGLAEFAFDVGREPLAWKSQKRIILSNDLVTEDDIADMVEKLGGFGTDNRAGIERQLHRISCIRSRSDDIIGLTFRLGRHVTGIADMIADLLFKYDDKSILFLGEPGCGKTTIVRGATSLLARQQNVCIVDTSNEIAGDGAVPHSCVGYARRMMVKTLNDQANVMVECVQNHTPEVIVIDEIGRPLEVDAALTCKQRGVRMVASAHGDLRKLIKNRKLRGLIGGVETVTLGDSAALAEAKRRNNNIANGLSKVKSQRGGEPVFDIIVELNRGQWHEWCIVDNTARAVDAILDGGQYEVERRERNPNSGTFRSFQEFH